MMKYHSFFILSKIKNLFGRYSKTPIDYYKQHPIYDSVIEELIADGNSRRPSAVLSVIYHNRNWNHSMFGKVRINGNADDCINKFISMKINENYTYLGRGLYTRLIFIHNDMLIQWMELQISKI